MDLSKADANMLIAAYAQKDVFPKALASFMFREIIEDAHVKYNISQEDMKAICKEAMNRAAAFIAIKETAKALQSVRHSRIEWHGS